MLNAVGVFTFQVKITCRKTCRRSDLSTMAIYFHTFSHRFFHLIGRKYVGPETTEWRPLEPLTNYQREILQRKHKGELNPERQQGGASLGDSEKFIKFISKTWTKGWTDWPTCLVAHSLLSTRLEIFTLLLWSWSFLHFLQQLQPKRFTTQQRHYFIINNVFIIYASCPVSQTGLCVRKTFTFFLLAKHSLC